MIEASPDTLEKLREKYGDNEVPGTKRAVCVDSFQPVVAVPSPWEDKTYFVFTLEMAYDVKAGAYREHGKIWKADLLTLNIPESSNGRTAAFDSANIGSNPISGSK